MKATDRPFLPYGRQLIEEEEIDAVTSVLRSDYLTTGPIVEAFEKKLAATTGSLHAISTSSGTAALHISSLAIGLKPGDIAIAPSMTFLSTVNAALYAGSDVVFADVDPDTGLKTSDGLEKALNKGEGIDSFKRYIYIHGTSEEGRLGSPASHGCIRMKNKEVIELYEKIKIGTLVLIL